jgi:ppGpp synthetase/RelA/SpoT-type nucleotidyltranferase
MSADQKPDDPVLDFLAEALPGEPEPAKAFQKTVKKKTEDHRELLQGVESWLDKLTTRFTSMQRNAEGSTRYVCSLDTSNKEKFWYTIADKCYRDKNDDNKNQNEKSTIDNFYRTMTDLVRLRVVCSFMSDVDLFKEYMEKIFENEKNNHEFKMKFLKNTINQHIKDRKSGHRSIKYRFSSTPYTEEPDAEIYLELQIMTSFQVAWDQKDHFLVYESARKHQDQTATPFPNYEDELAFSMGGTLLVLDTLFDEIKRKREKE